MAGAEPSQAWGLLRSTMRGRESRTPASAPEAPQGDDRTRPCLHTKLPWWPMKDLQVREGLTAGPASPGGGQAGAGQALRATLEGVTMGVAQGTPGDELPIQGTQTDLGRGSKTPGATQHHAGVPGPGGWNPDGRGGGGRARPRALGRRSSDTAATCCAGMAWAQPGRRVGSGPPPTVRATGWSPGRPCCSVTVLQGLVSSLVSSTAVTGRPAETPPQEPPAPPEPSAHSLACVPLVPIRRKPCCQLDPATPSFASQLTKDEPQLPTESSPHGDREPGCSLKGQC